MNRLHKTKTIAAARGQALIEFLILLPVLLVLFLATAEIAKLFAISGKTEVAARYAALRYFRNAPFEPSGHDFQAPLDPTAAAEEVGDLFFEGSLNDSDATDVDTGYYEFEAGDAGVFNYEPPELDALFWDIIVAYFDPQDKIFPIRGHRVTFEYDLPSFPYKELTDDSGWGEDADPLGPYTNFTAKGDFVTLTDTFSGDTDEFLALLAATGLILDIDGGIVSAGIGFLIFFMLLGGGS